MMKERTPVEKNKQHVPLMAANHVPRLQSAKKPRSRELFWCKCQRYPYWKGPIVCSNPGSKLLRILSSYLTYLVGSQLAPTRYTLDAWARSCGTGRMGYVSKRGNPQTWPQLSFRRPFKTGLWGMATSVIQQKGLPKDYVVDIKGDSLVSQKWGDIP